MVPNCEIQYTFTCVACDLKHVVRLQHIHTGAIPLADIPFEWHIIDGSPVCPRHTIKVGVPE